MKKSVNLNSVWIMVTRCYFTSSNLHRFLWGPYINFLAHMAGNVFLITFLVRAYLGQSKASQAFQCWVLRTIEGETSNRDSNGIGKRLFLRISSMLMVILLFRKRQWSKSPYLKPYQYIPSLNIQMYGMEAKKMMSLFLILLALCQKKW